MAVIMVMSSASFSSQRTGGILIGLLAALPAWMVAVEPASLHAVVRKAAHVVEYAILALLWFRTFVRDPARPTWWAAAGAFTICVAWAALDETHQWFVPGRTGSASDVALDAAGSLAMLAVARRTWRDTGRALVTVLLWTAAVGGAVAVATDQMRGTSSSRWWVTAPTAAGGLISLWWWGRSPN
jgi:VanZ family protein